MVVMDIKENRFSRQELFPFIGEIGQKKLFDSRIVIAGMGALGTAIASQLVRAGVGYVRIIDRDFVEYSNLQRQVLYDENDAAENYPKAIAAKLKLKNINSKVVIDAKIADITWKNAEELLTGVDLILDGTDNFETKYLINDVALKHKIPWIYGEAICSKGITYTIIPEKTACFTCIYPEHPAHGTIETCGIAGVISPIANLVAAYQATEALKILVEDYEHLNTTLLSFDLWKNDYKKIEIANSKKTDCPVCAHKQYENLEPKNKKERFVSLCGNDTVQISPPKNMKFDLKQLAEKLRKAGKVEETEFLLKFMIDDYNLTIFPNGKIMVHGTNDVIIAKSLYTRYIGN